MPTIASLRKDGDIYTLTVSYLQRQNKVKETFIGTSSQLISALNQRQYESDYPNKPTVEGVINQSQLFTANFIKIIHRQIANDGESLTPNEGIRTADAGFLPSGQIQRINSSEVTLSLSTENAFNYSS